MKETLTRYKLRVLQAWLKLELAYLRTLRRFKTWQLNRLGRKRAVLESAAFVQEDDDDE